VRWFKKGEEALFRTHQAPFQSPEWAIGQVVQHGEYLYRVTQWVELRSVLLERGGSVREWEVWGRRLSDKEMRDEVLGAAERIKDGDA
jgi:hypothetical protein